LQGYRVLLLPQSVAMSAEECRRVAEFVRAGGTVIADNMTATMDEHCRRLPHGQLDGLFGIDNGVPMAITKQAGKGHAVYLNIDMHDYGKQRLKLDGAATRDLFASTLSKAGVTPQLRVVDARDGKPVPCVRVWRFAADDGTWYAVMRNPEVNVKAMKEVGYPDNSAIEVPMKVRIGTKEMELDPTRPLIFKE